MRISLAYSPDTDDAFMAHAMREGLVDTGTYQFEYDRADIQELNDRAKKGVHDVTAISIAAYPALSAEYLLMPIGASIGDDFGPAIVSAAKSPLRSPSELKGKRVAIPGLETSAYFAARSLIGEFEPVPMYFLDIEDAVKDGRVDGGILIHELQLDCEARSLKKLGDLGKMWMQRYHLPLPLGANAIRRRLGAVAIREVTDIMRASIEQGLKDRKGTLAAAMHQSTADMDESLGDRYISMYVNHRSLRVESDVKKAIEVLYDIGQSCGLCPQVDLEDSLYE